MNSLSDSILLHAELKFDRAEHLRKLPEELEKLKASPDSRLVCWSEDRCLCIRQDDTFVPVYLTPHSKYVSILDASIGDLFLGIDKETKAPIFAGCIKDRSSLDLKADLETVQSQWYPLRQIAPQMQLSDVALFAIVNGMMEWHSRNLFDGRTGQPLISTQGGYARKLNDSDRVLFPRIDPAMICLVAHGEYCLLGRKPGWSDRRRYSLLAGFLEIGETLEQTVEREVFEEASVKIDLDSVRYLGSQPWPFPQSLMIGFTAEIKAQVPEWSDSCKDAAKETCVTDSELGRYLGYTLPTPIPQPEEMEDVRWFHFDYIQSQLDLEEKESQFTIPSSFAIANRILRHWMKTIQSNRSKWKGDRLVDVNIDTGRFKYILARISDSTHSKIVVRGRRNRSYHMNVFEDLQEEAHAIGVEAICLGGGRIEHDPSQKEIYIYGYSSGYGTAVHDITAVLCKRAFPFYTKITVAYSGY